MHLPTPHWVHISAVSDPKWHETNAPPSYSPDLTQSNYFFVPSIKKILKGKCFANVKEVKQNTPEALKGIKIDEFKNCLSSGKNVSIGVLHQMEIT